MKVAVVGAGPAGLAAAWELKHLGFTVDIFEAHSKPGGCASYFRRKVQGSPVPESKVLFDAGATVLWSLREGEFFSEHLKKWGVQIPAFNTSESHAFSFVNELTTKQFILNTRDENTWIQSLKEQFPHDLDFIDRHFPKFFKIAKALNETLYKIPAEPFLSLEALKHNLKLINSVTPIIPAFLSYPAKFSELIAPCSNEFKEWAESLLLITLQARSEEVESLYGISALCFLALGSGTLDGGMESLFSSLASQFPDSNSRLFFRSPVLKITNDAGYTLHTPTANYSGYTSVMLSTPRWNSEYLFDEPLFSYANTLEWDSHKNKLWSAVVAYLVFEDTPTLPDTAFNHLVKNADGEFYFSVSKRNDSKRGPSTMRVVTASTHERLENWTYNQYIKKKPFADRENYEAQKESWKLKFLNASKFVFKSPALFSEIGTPKTFLAYTLRKEGFVGGIPLTRDFSFLKSPSQLTRFPNVYQIGDTAFPGQSVVNCAVGALEAVRKIKQNSP